MIRKYRIHIIMFSVMLILFMASRWVMMYSTRDQYGIVDAIYNVFNPIVAVIPTVLRVSALFLCVEAIKVFIKLIRYEESKKIKLLITIVFLINILVLGIIAGTFTEKNITTILGNYIYATLICVAFVIFILINIVNEYILYRRLEIRKTECYRIIQNIEQDNLKC